MVPPAQWPGWDPGEWKIIGGQLKTNDRWLYQYYCNALYHCIEIYYSVLYCINVLYCNILLYCITMYCTESLL